MIRVRRLPSQRFKRRWYEVQFIEPNTLGPKWSKKTRTPIAEMEQVLGVGDAWAVLRAADRAWNGGLGDWVTLFGN